MKHIQPCYNINAFYDFSLNPNHDIDLNLTYQSLIAGFVNLAMSGPTMINVMRTRMANRSFRYLLFSSDLQKKYLFFHKEPALACCI